VILLKASDQEVYLLMKVQVVDRGQIELQRSRMYHQNKIEYRTNQITLKSWMQQVSCVVAGCQIFGNLLVERRLYRSIW
jgi:uncharacterized membrane protein YecN with MAPEG domain